MWEPQEQGITLCLHRMGLGLLEVFKLNTICIRIVAEMFLCLHSNSKSPREHFNKELMSDYNEYF
jgi:hypothetical protein